MGGRRRQAKTGKGTESTWHRTEYETKIEDPLFYLIMTASLTSVLMSPSFSYPSVRLSNNAFYGSPIYNRGALVLNIGFQLV
uniref:Uncharacterized protein n=1 Tax=Romanomermis culicivorax TaxID=13658 RepID=A0A915JEV0_ROMCU